MTKTWRTLGIEKSGTRKRKELDTDPFQAPLAYSFALDKYRTQMKKHFLFFFLLPFVTQKMCTF